MLQPLVLGVACASLLALGATRAQVQIAPDTPERVNPERHPILFVTQVPVPEDFTTIGAPFGNHRASMDAVARGGDLWIRYPDGTLKNLTKLAGFGKDGFQDDTSIAVREPSVHWSGQKALFSMVIGAPEKRYEWETYYWQIYEVTGLGKDDKPQITHVAKQPARFNNVSPVYGTDGRILFTSDRPRNGQRHLYPQRDEYETAPTVSGVWSLDPATGDLFLVVHAPSGDFSPLVDSYGRVLFTQWDHLQRDQQADADELYNGGHGTFNWSSEAVNSRPLDTRLEVFPEPRPARSDLLRNTNLLGHRFNHFFPWMVHEDGTGLETLNHIGRHELHSYLERAINDDRNVRSLSRRDPVALNMLQLDEDTRRRGYYYGTNAPEFFTHSAGQLVALYAPPGANPDSTRIEYLTHPDTSDYTKNAGPNHSGLYREPLSMSDGRLIAVHTDETDRDTNIGTRALPKSRYAFRVKELVRKGTYYVAGKPLTPGIRKSVSWYDPDVLVRYTGELWELNPVEVRARPVPRFHKPGLEMPERLAFATSKVDEVAFRRWLAQRSLAVIVSRNVTSRDRNDRQQPFNLRVAGTQTRTIGASGRTYDIRDLQIFEADQLRGNGGTKTPYRGRRVLAVPLHNAPNLPNPGGPLGSVRIASDGSTAAFVPARRALTWQLTAPDRKSVVRERYWLSFQPGEVRSCASCHGLNTRNQAGQLPPQNTPRAFVELLSIWKSAFGK